MASVAALEQFHRRLDLQSTLASYQLERNLLAFGLFEIGKIPLITTSIMYASALFDTAEYGP